MNIFQKIEGGVEVGIKDAETFLVDEFGVLKGVIAPAVVTAVNAVSAAEASGVLPAIALALSPVTKGLSVAINNQIEAGLPTAIAIALGIEGLPADPTPAELTAFGQAALNAIEKIKGSGAVSGTWQVNLAGQIYGLIQSAIAANAGTAQAGTLTLGQITVLVEQAFEDADADKAAAAQPVAASN